MVATGVPPTNILASKFKNMEEFLEKIAEHLQVTGQMASQSFSEEQLQQLDSVLEKRFVALEQKLMSKLDTIATFQGGQQQNVSARTQESQQSRTASSIPAVPFSIPIQAFFEVWVCGKSGRDALPAFVDIGKEAFFKQWNDAKAHNAQRSAYSKGDAVAKAIAFYLTPSNDINGFRAASTTGKNLLLQAALKHLYLFLERKEPTEKDWAKFVTALPSTIYSKICSITEDKPWKVQQEN